MGDGSWRERGDEAPTVALCLQPRVKHSQNSPILPMPDQATQTLLERQDGQRHLGLREWLDASPTTSTHCQKLDVASSTALGVLRNSASSCERGAVPWTKIG